MNTLLVRVQLNTVRSGLFSNKELKAHSGAVFKRFPFGTAVIKDCMYTADLLRGADSIKLELKEEDVRAG